MNEKVLFSNLIYDERKMRPFASKIILDEHIHVLSATVDNQLQLSVTVNIDTQQRGVKENVVVLRKEKKEKM
jgi:hypothetical protein